MSSVISVKVVSFVLLVGSGVALLSWTTSVVTVISSVGGKGVLSNVPLAVLSVVIPFSSVIVAVGLLNSWFVVNSDMVSEVSSVP